MKQEMLSRWSLAEASRWRRQDCKNRWLLEYIDQGGVVKTQWCSDTNTVDAEVMVRSSPMTGSSSSSRRHRIRHPMEARYSSKSMKKQRRVMETIMNEIDRKVDRAIVVEFRRSRCRTLCFSTFWMQWWVQIEEISISDASSVQID